MPTGETLPSGTVTFLFTDIEGSTKLLAALGTDRYHQVLEVHTQVLRSAFAPGHEVRVEGDALFMVFATASTAIAAAAAAQRTLATTAFPHQAVVRVRMGMHTGSGTPASRAAGADYVGIDVHRAARIAAVAHGGQVLISGATAMLGGDDLPEGTGLRDLGEHRLKDLAQPERIHQLVIAGCASDFPPLRSLDATPNNLPTQLTTFIGREREIADGLALLGRTRLLTLTGPGGTGKTRLSLQLAAEAAGDFRDGAFWVALAPISDPELVPSTIAHALGIQVGGQERPLDRVEEHLRGKQLLLVLDNFEQILPAATVVGSLLETATDLKVLTSSRAPLRISGEQEYPIPPLDLPDPDRLPSLEVLTQSDAVRLFVERARAVKPDFVVTAENAGPIAEICYRLDGLPLALELAAARVKLLSPQAILPRLRHGLDLLASSAPDRTDRQRTLRGAIGWSYDLLDPGMQRLFRRCAVFVGGAALEQLEAICGPEAEIGRAVLDGVSELFDHSLIRQVESNGEPRFRMLVTIREFALEALAASEEAPLIHGRHAARYLQLAKEAAPHLQGKDVRGWLDRLELEHDNLRAALECDIDSGRTEDAARLVAALWRFWQMRGHLREGRAWGERVLAMPGQPPLARLRALEAVGGMAYWQADERVVDLYREAYELAQAHGDTALRASAAYNYSFTFTIAGVSRPADPEAGRRYLEESLLGYRELGDRAAIGRAAWALAVTYTNGVRSPEELARGRAYGEEALREHRTLAVRNLFDEGWDLHALGLIALKLGELDDAAAIFRESLALFVSLADTSGIVLMLSNIAEVARQRGDLERHDVLVGAWSALSERTGVGLATVYGVTEGRIGAADIPVERRPALDRGIAMTTDDAVAYALGGPAAR